jgi:hypothetical protein
MNDAENIPIRDSLEGLLRVLLEWQTYLNLERRNRLLAIRHVRNKLRSFIKPRFEFKTHGTSSTSIIDGCDGPVIDTIPTYLGGFSGEVTRLSYGCPGATSDFIVKKIKDIDRKPTSLRSQKRTVEKLIEYVRESLRPPAPERTVSKRQRRAKKKEPKRCVPVPPSEPQRLILENLKFVARTEKELKIEIERVTGQEFPTGTLKENLQKLMKTGKLKNRRGAGYFRSDKSPPPP